VELSSTAQQVEAIASKETLEIGNRKLPQQNRRVPLRCNQHPQSATEVSSRIGQTMATTQSSSRFHCQRHPRRDP
jgi:hypothetical protein